MLAAVTCFYNPCGYRRNLENYFRFRDALGYPLTTVELSFTGKFAISDAIHLHGDAQHIMWQKERLLNIGMESLPEEFDKIAWIDSDLLFMNRHWVEQTEELLDRFQAVHLCERVHQTNLQGHITSSLETFGKGFIEQRLQEQWFHTGGAWAARREALQPDGLFDRDIIGGADAFLAFAWSGDIERSIFHAKKTFSAKTQNYYRQQAERLYQQVQGNISYVPGDTIHLWHGEKQNRLYVTRLEFLKQYDFDPQTDIAIDSNGLWKWNSDKPGMHRDVANYFQLRQEDGPADQQSQLNGEVQNDQPEPKIRRNVTDWSVGVTTAPREKPTLEASLESLCSAGFDRPRLFAEPETKIPEKFHHLPISQRDVTLGAFPNWYLALTEMVLRDPRAEAYLLCQDDVLYATGLRDYLEQQLWPSTNTGVVSIYCPSHYASGNETGFVQENRGWKSWGALAYCFPNRVARQLLCDPAVLNHRDYGPRDGLKNIDSVVGAFCQKQGLDYFVHTRSLAQHTGATSTIWNSKKLHSKRVAKDFQKEC